MPPAPPKPVSLFSKVAVLAKSPQFGWFLAHTASVLCFVVLQTVLFFSRRLTLRFYRLALVFQMVSYGIVAHQLGVLTKFSLKNKQLIHNENIQYLFFCVVLLVASIKLGPWSKSLYSFVIFAFFHSIAYFQSNLLDVMPMSIPSQAALSDRITFISSHYNQQALYFAAMNEVFLLVDFMWAIPTLLFKVFSDPLYVVFQAFLVVSVALFLKLRYLHSTYTRTVLEQFDARIMGLLSHPMVPPVILQFYTLQFKVVVKRITDLIPTPTQVAKKSE